MDGDATLAAVWIIVGQMEQIKLPKGTQWITLCMVNSVEYFSWNSEKNEQLQRESGISFEEVVWRIQQGDLLAILRHPNQEKYYGQRIFVVQINDYAYLVPFVRSENRVFLKTIIPSRKATRQYLGKK